MANGNDKAAILICLNEDSSLREANEHKFKQFWEQVKDCKVHPSLHLHDCNPKDLTKELRTYNEKCRNCKTLVVGISADGIEDEKSGIVSFDIKWGQRRAFSLAVNKVLEIFDGNDKINIILLQMCRIRSDSNTYAQSGIQHGVPLHTSDPSNSDQGDTAVPELKTWKLAQPCIKNSIVVLSAPSGYYAHSNLYVDEDCGGWLFIAMNEILKGVRGKSVKLLKLFIMVNQKMSEMTSIDGRETGMSSFNHMLTENIQLQFKE